MSNHSNMMYSFNVEVMKYRKLYPSLREGQVLFNALSDFDAYIANEICGGFADPFYDDNNISAFYNYLESVWKDE